MGLQWTSLMLLESLLVKNARQGSHTEKYYGLRWSCGWQYALAWPCWQCITWWMFYLSRLGKECQLMHHSEPQCQWSQVQQFNKLRMRIHCVLHHKLMVTEMTSNLRFETDRFWCKLMPLLIWKWTENIERRNLWNLLHCVKTVIALATQTGQLESSTLEAFKQSQCISFTVAVSSRVLITLSQV